MCKAQSFHHFLKKSQIFSHILVAHLRVQGLQGGVESRNPQPFTILLAYLPFPLWHNGKDFLLWSCMAFPHQAPLSGVSVCLLVNCGSFTLEVEFDFSFNTIGNVEAIRVSTDRGMDIRRGQHIQWDSIQP